MARPKPTTAGETMVCPTCNGTVTAKMTTYADYTNYLQWQNNDNKAHFDSQGNCKSSQTGQQTQQTTETKPVQSKYSGSYKTPITKATEIYNLAEAILDSFKEKRKISKKPHELGEGELPELPTGLDVYNSLSTDQEAVFIESVFRTLSQNYKVIGEDN